MWDDVVVGSGNSLNGACLVRRLEKADISENAASYWINNAYLGGSMTVFKNTPEGVTLKTMLTSGTLDEEIANWLENLFLDHVENDRLKRLVTSAMMRAATDARRQKAKDIRKAFRRAFEKIDEY